MGGQSKSENETVFYYSKGGFEPLSVYEEQCPLMVGVSIYSLSEN